MSDKVIIIIPAYNEERTIEGVLREVRAVMPQADILVVNDGSGDRTADVAKRAGAKVVSLPYNLGYGVALQTGFKFAYKYRYDYAVQMDGDGQHTPSSIPSLLDALRGGPADNAGKEAGIPPSEQDEHTIQKKRTSGIDAPERPDVVIGSRFRGGAKFKSPLLRRIGMKFFGFLASVIVRGKITDPTSGFQALNRHAIRFNSSDYYPVDFPDADYLVMLHRAGLKVEEVAVKMNPPPPGKKSMHAGFKPLYYIFNMLLSLLVVVLRKHDFKKEE